MKRFDLEKNRAFALLETVISAVRAAFSSISVLGRSALGKETSAIPANRFFEALHFLFVSGPRHFWKKPTGIAAGRSIGTFLHFLLEKPSRFSEKTKSGGRKGFTMIETMVSIVVLAISLVAALQAYGQIGFFRTKVSGKLDLGQDLHYNVERFVELVKNGGTVDYEEYFNRRVVGTGMTAGHYSLPTGFGNYGTTGVVGTNFGNGPYLCRSNGGTRMGTDGCFSSAFNSLGGSQVGNPQRYGEFALQYVDYNSNATADGSLPGDEDGNGKIAGDDDDESLGVGPEAFPAEESLAELCLLKKSGAIPERLVLRRRVILDPLAPAASCDLVTATGTGCLGRLEMLRLVGRDYGESHTWAAAVTSTGRFDGKIDTWECRSDFQCLGPENTPTGADGEWVSVFPDDINVLDAKFFPTPNKDSKSAWKDDTPSVRSAPALRMSFTIGFSQERRRKNNGDDPRVNITTTVSLSP